MEPITLTPPQTDAALARLDGLISEVAPFGHGPESLLHEHLQSARVYLLGGMLAEYEFSLDAAQTAAAQLTDPTRQALVTRELTTLQQCIGDLHAPWTLAWHQPRGVPHAGKTIADSAKHSDLYRFFHGSGTKLGVFYPTHYIFAAFPSYHAAKAAASRLRDVGFSAPEVVAVTATDTLRFFEEVRADAGISGAVMASVSRFFGTEEVFADIDVDESREGAGFLAVYCPEEEEAEQVRDLLEPLEPMTMQLYLPGGVRSLVAGTSPGPQGHHTHGN